MSITKNINDDLHKNLHVKPLEEGEVAVFKLIRAGTFDPMRGIHTNPNSHTVPGIEIIRDPFNNRTVRIYNIEEFEAVDPGNGQAPFFKVKHKAVTFDEKGVITCNSDKNDLYMFMKRSSYNRDNKYRSTKYAPLFYEVNFERDARVAVDLTEYKRLALNIVAMTPNKMLVALGSELKNFNIALDLNQKAVQMRQSLNAIAEGQSEKLILASDDNAAKTRIYVDRAIDRLLIMFNPDDNKWFWSQSSGNNKKIIVAVEEGNDPKSELIDFLCNDKSGSTHRTELVSRVSNEETYQEPASKAIAASGPDLVKNWTNKQKKRVADVAPLEGL